MLATLLFPAVLAATAGAGAWMVHRWRRRGTRAGLRALGWALLPLGAYLSGLLTLAVRVGAALAGWATHLVLNPLTWAGAGLLAVAALLLGGTSWLARRPGRVQGPDGGAPPLPGVGPADPLADLAAARQVLREVQGPRP